jgi:hypothetical protein
MMYGLCVGVLIFWIKLWIKRTFNNFSVLAIMLFDRFMESWLGR